MQKSDFNVVFNKDLANVNTLSPNGLFFYKLQFPVELNKSAFGCNLVFYSIGNQLIYHNEKFRAHELHTKEEIESIKEAMKSQQYDLIEPQSSLEFVKWSAEGNMAFFWEYYSWNDIKSFESVFINLTERYCYRIDELENDSEIISQIRPIDQEYSEQEVIKVMDSLGFNREALIADKINENIIINLFKKKWFPNIKR